MLYTLSPRKLAIQSSRNSLTHGFSCCSSPLNLRSKTPKLTNFSNKSGVKDHVDKILSSREDLDYEIDGAVVKVDDFSKQEKLGFVSKAPRWAVAWKFPATEKVSKVKKVLFSVGRTGVITPFATI